MASIGELLAYFHSIEYNNVENIAPLTDETQLRNGTVAWKSVGIHWNDPGAQCEETSDIEKWNWLWNQIVFNQSQFGVVAGIRTQDIGSLFERLKGLKLIYPDGTINGMARQFLQSQIMAKLSGNKGRGRPKKQNSDKK